MQTATSSSPQDTIQWRQLSALIALDVAIIISWIAYHEYQPKLLAQFKFTEFGLMLKVIQGIILFITPPLAGLIADRIRQQNGNRLPVISVGINFVSMVFMAVAFTVLTEPTGFIRNLFPLMIVLWLMSMNIFHSPAISTVELFVPPQKLPQVAAIFAVIAGLAEALEPSIVDIIDLFGAPITFAVGGILVFVTGYLLQKATKDLTTQSGSESYVGYDSVKTSNFLLVFMLGLGMGIFTAVFFKLFPAWAEMQLPFLQANNFKGSFFISILVGLGAVLSLPLSRQVERYGVEKSALLGFGLASILVLLIYVNLNPYLNLMLYIAFPIAFALISVTALPIAFLNLCNRNKVLGIGLFFSGVELAGSVLEILQAL
jgi:hypothetical protein